MSENLDTLSAAVRATRRHLDQQAGELHALARRGKALQGEIRDLHTHIGHLHQAAAVLSSIAETRQQALHQRVETLVTQGLRVIFGDDLSFHLVPAMRAKTPVTDLIVRSSTPDGVTLDTDVLDARGGGLAAIVGFLLRLIHLLLRPGGGPVILVLDETFAHVSAEYEPRLAAFLRELVSRTGAQIILVTHSDAYHQAADVRYRFTQRDGDTHAATA